MSAASIILIIVLILLIIFFIWASVDLSFFKDATTTNLAEINSRASTLLWVAIAFGILIFIMLLAALYFSSKDGSLKSALSRKSKELGKENQSLSTQNDNLIKEVDKVVIRNNEIDNINKMLAKEKNTLDKQVNNLNTENAILRTQTVQPVNPMNPIYPQGLPPSPYSYSTTQQYSPPQTIYSPPQQYQQCIPMVNTTPNIPMLNQNGYM